MKNSTSLKGFKKSIMYAYMYGAGWLAIKRKCRESKIRHIPARSKVRIARQVISNNKSFSFASRYSGNLRSEETNNLVLVTSLWWLGGI